MSTTLQALKVLIEHSSLLTAEVKEKLKNTITHASEEDIEAMGKLFATEKEQTLATLDKDLEAMDAVLKKVEETRAVDK